MTGTATFQGTLDTTWAGSSVMFDLVTHAGHQYAAYYNANREITVAHRTVGATDGPWTYRVLHESNYTGTDPNDPVHYNSFKKTWDIHNWLRLGVDGSGNVHLSGDMHDNEFRYWRTSTPGDLGTLARHNFLDTTSKITYPEFINKANGDLGWLMLRKGVSGNGDTWVYKWNNNTASWNAGTKVFESAAPSGYVGSVYSEVFFTLDGWFHLVFNWREGPGANTNTKFSYVKTKDFVSFVDGKEQTVNLPMTYDSTRPPVDPITGGDANFVNNEYQFITTGTWTVLAYEKTAPDGTKQVFLATRNSITTGWSINQATNEPGGVSWGFGNMFPENYVVPIDQDTVAIDFNYSTGTAGYTRRVTVYLPNVAAGPFPSVTAPRYFPDAVFQTPDSFNGCTSRVKSDSRSLDQTAGNRFYIASRPEGNTAYVLSWLAGPETFSPLPPEPSYPLRPINVYKITY
jgi:hypothetical protein